MSSGHFGRARHPQDVPRVRGEPWLTERRLTSEQTRRQWRFQRENHTKLPPPGRRFLTPRKRPTAPQRTLCSKNL